MPQSSVFFVSVNQPKKSCVSILFIFNRLFAFALTALHITLIERLNKLQEVIEIICADLTHRLLSALA